MQFQLAYHNSGGFNYSDIEYMTCAHLRNVYTEFIKTKEEEAKLLDPNNLTNKP